MNRKHSVLFHIIVTLLTGGLWLLWLLWCSLNDRLKIPKDNSQVNDRPKMYSYNLQSNESFILNNEHVSHNNSSGELILTTLNLVYISTKGLFRKTHSAHQYPISQIRVSNGKAQAIMGKNGKIDIYFINGQESFKFWNNEPLFSEKKAEKEAAKWANAINQLLSGQIPEIGYSVNMALPGTEYVAETLKDTIGTVKETLGVKTKINNRIPEKTAKKCRACGASISGTKGQIVHCQYCNTEQQL